MTKDKILRGLLIFSFLAVGVSLVDFAGECSGEAQELALFAFFPLSYIAIYGYISYYRLEADNKRLQHDNKQKHHQALSFAIKRKNQVEEMKQLRLQISKLQREARRWEE